MRNLTDKTAVVTGAGSGIGRAVAELLAEKGCHVAVCDVNADNVSETAHRIQATGRRVSRHIVDVSDRSRMEALPQEVVAEHGGVQVLVNNAGVTAVGEFETLSLEDFEWLMGINFWGVVYGCRFFLPVLRQSREAHIVNMSSVFGLVGVPMQSSYCASKFAVRGLSESLRTELEPSGIGVTSVHPAGVATQIAESARYSGERTATTRRRVTEMLARALSPERAASLIVKGILENRERVLVGRDAYVIDSIQRAAPALAEALKHRIYRRLIGARASAE